MTMQERNDGSRYPDDAEQNSVLADFTDERGETGLGYECNRTLGDLIVDVLAGRDVIEGCSNGAHQDYESFEHAFLQRIALELRVLNHAAAIAGGLTTDDHPADEITQHEVCEYMRGLARRVTAGAELSERLRNARWGHPSFGGGEAHLAEERAASKAKADACTCGAETGLDPKCPSHPAEGEAQS